ncbi:Sensory transduction protein regX3 [Bacillus sp. THAF10]|uniref:response regulator transcription factor n=1 Tax=Bacillus sp. THAF10 TaxID=2587848 RepID=UPI0012A79C47|nr:response regulator transcription factor [Bacillus sp. THAF10]QFT90779.1 Sensory transduction protein regX3 [Bacillus sp. THAF10]
MQKRIYIAEDDYGINQLLSIHLKKDGYQVEQAYSGEEVLKKLEERVPDLLILDLMMPGIDGLQVIEQVRRYSKVPIMLLTARGEDRDKVAGFKIGADDYLVKPFSMVELLSRVHALIRRCTDYGTAEQEFIQNGDLAFDTVNQEFTVNGTALTLKPKETKLLSIFMNNINRLYTKAQLYELVWNTDYLGDSNTIMVHISRIREQIEPNPKSPIYIKTIKGLGYRMVQHES